jgi:hypothetical protein
LPAHGEARRDHGRCVTRVDEQADREINQEGDHENLGRAEVADEPGAGEGHEGEQEQDARRGAYLAFIEHRYFVAGDVFSKSAADDGDVLAHVFSKSIRRVAGADSRVVIVRASAGRQPR